MVKSLCERGDRVVLLDNLSAYPFDYCREYGLERLNVEIVKGDLRNVALLSQLVAKADRVIHMAALADVAECTRDPRKEFEANVVGTQNLLDVARNSNIKKLTFISSASVYGSRGLLSERAALEENLQCLPISNYGLSKLWGEQRCRLYHRFYGLPTTALRLFSIYGSPQVPKPGSHSWCVAIFAMRLKLGKPVTIFGNGEQVRDFIHVTDASDAIVLATVSEDSVGKIINIGTGLATSINTLCHLVASLMQTRCDVEYLPSRDDDPVGGYANTSLCKATLGWRSGVQLKDGIREYLNWLDNHMHLIPHFISSDSQSLDAHSRGRSV